ncbi:calcium-binding protein [Herbaspirillum sp. alder98]|uniref:calcium-binding protein n=1 Tax=Herbaspirillum sp. alder98 TaxID=2913096 RepID=UPI001CD8C85A|nr:calcium-binding protein [Herbaspirillum sp. alder98]MCA1323183.1 calcium-binding protein [Herbaspirillum sp. alder98]
MSNAGFSSLLFNPSPPSRKPFDVRQDGADLMITSRDGQREWEIRNYFLDMTADAQAGKLAGLVLSVWGEHHPARHDSSLMLGSPMDDVMLGNDDDLRILADEGDDVVVAFAGADYLDGGAGRDWLYGGAGTDILEGGKGNDRLYGETGDDKLLGGEGRDMLFGGAGNDLLYGGKGDDALGGGKGNDTYEYQRGDGQDRIFNQGGAADHDVMRFTGDITVEQLWFRRIGNDLRVNLVGTEEGVTFVSWYVNDAQRVDELVLSNGESIQTLDKTGVEALVDAMSSFAPPPPGSTFLPDEYRMALSPTLAAHVT